MVIVALSILAPRPALAQAADDAELRALRAENKMLQSTLDQRNKEIAALKEEMKSLKGGQGAPVTRPAPPKKEVQPAALKAVQPAQQKQTKEQKRAEYKAILDAMMLKKDFAGIKPTMVGDETNLTFIIANPLNYVNKPVVVCGLVRASDYYNWGYKDAQLTHYSIKFVGVNANREKFGTATLYALRGLGDEVVRMSAKVNEVNPGDIGLLMKFVITINSNRVENLPRLQDRVYEVLDWQFYDDDNKKWGPWRSEVVD